MNKILQLRKELVEMAKYGSALAVLSWDEQTYMPPAGRAFRGDVNALISTDLHKRYTSKEFVSLVKELHEPKNYEVLSDDEKVIVRETWKDVEKAIKIPSEFVEKFSKLTTKAFGAWEEAREKSDFKIFQPLLEEIVQMKKQEVEFVGYKDSPYDALLDDFEPGLTSERLDELFVPMANELSDLIKKVAGKSKSSLPKAMYPVADQEKLNEEVAKAMGYDFKAGRVDISTHPFTMGFHPTDVRITTRYDENNFYDSLGSVIHEAGHALYEQGLPAEEFGTPLGEVVSLGMHESQSRIWENMVGRSPEFCQYLNTQLLKYFPKVKSDVDELYGWLNRVEPSLIRVESDETTYNLHIILRYELERDLTEGKLKVAELPEAWNAKVKKYLGIDVPDDAHGVLQDVHWSSGLMGYFPTYTLGNLYAAQIFNKVKADIPGLEANFAKGEFNDFLKWLRTNIHQYGSRYKPEELIKNATGEDLNPEYLIRYLKDKAEQ